MARSNRQQRRARRRENAPAQPAEQPQPAAPKPQAGPSRRDRARQQQARPATSPVSEQAGRREPRERGRFIRESWAELNKVEWPGRSQVIAGTVAVIIACVIVGAYLWVADLALQRVVERVLL